MHLKNVVIPLALLSTAVADQAPVNSNSPKKVVARADFDNEKLHGIIKFQAPNGTVRVHVDLTGLPEEGGPFQYHIHKKPVPESGDCYATETHFNPYNAPPDCEAQQDDSYCQVGDLSGKHGFINTTCFETRYWDPYLSLNPKSKAYPVGLSINLHYANLTRFACANIKISKEKVDKKNDLELRDLKNYEEENEEEELVPLEYAASPEAISVQEDSNTLKSQFNLRDDISNQNSTASNTTVTGSNVTNATNSTGAVNGTSGTYCSTQYENIAGLNSFRSGSALAVIAAGIASYLI